MRQLAFQNCILLILLTGYSSSAVCQVIKGIVLDEETKETIPFATVFIGGTFVGTSADQEGSFEIDISEYATMPIKISAIGYFTSSLAYPDIHSSNIVYLKPKLYEIFEAEVKTKSLARERKRNLRIFRAEFIGSSGNAQNCAIINEEDITFNYGSDRDTLKAFARKPIQIENRALGYIITYYLDIFEYYRHKRALYFSGEIIFNKDLNVKDPNMSYLINRADAYFGSRMHFFRALWVNGTKRNKFVITDSRKFLVDPNSVVDQSEKGKKYLTYPEELIIGFDRNRFSKIKFLQEKVLFDQFGYFDPAGISWEGDMGRSRMADWLPFDYSEEINQ